MFLPFTAGCFTTTIVNDFVMNWHKNLNNILSFCHKYATFLC